MRGTYNIVGNYESCNNIGKLYSLVKVLTDHKAISVPEVIIQPDRHPQQCARLNFSLTDIFKTGSDPRSSEDRQTGDRTKPRAFGLIFSKRVLTSKIKPGIEDLCCASKLILLTLSDTDSLKCVSSVLLNVCSKYRDHHHHQQKDRHPHYRHIQASVK
jgi:hypothetical protein